MIGIRGADHECILFFLFIYLLVYLLNMLLSVKVEEGGGTTLVSWTIATADANQSFQVFFLTLCLDREREFDILKCSVGDSKLNQSVVKESLNVTEVCNDFVKFDVKARGSAPDETSSDSDSGAGPSTRPRLINAFDVMMAARNRGPTDHMPQRKEPGGKYPNKDRLFNDVVKMLSQCSSDASSGSTDTTRGPNMGSVEDGKAFVTTLVDVLWYIDGHHKTLADRISIPQLFQGFEGYV